MVMPTNDAKLLAPPAVVVRDVMIVLDDVIVIVVIFTCIVVAIPLDDAELFDASVFVAVAALIIRK